MILVCNPKDEVILRVVVLPYLGINQPCNLIVMDKYIHLLINVRLPGNTDRNRLSLRHAANCRNRKRRLLGCQIVQARNIQR